MKNLTVYVTNLATNQTSSLGTVYALDTATGRPRWTHTIGDTVRSSPAVAGAPSTSAATERYTRWTPDRKHQARRSPQSRRDLPVPHIDPRHRLEARP